MKKIVAYLSFVGFLLVLCGAVSLPDQQAEDWGFVGHKRINRMAVFTLPPDMIGFYKTHIEYLTEHAVDPDKRRYATKFEAVRHYIDIDHHGVYPFPNLPRVWTDALAQFTDIFVVNSTGDTLQLMGQGTMTKKRNQLTLKSTSIQPVFGTDSLELDYQSYRAWFSRNVLPQYYEDEWIVSCDTLQLLFPELDCASVILKDELSPYGILPYHLLQSYRQLVRAFEKQEIDRILRLSAEFGHYIGDAHVPLHTTTNYNGQLTNQLGIHGFWESRLIELFSDEYDYFVGPANYIDNPRGYFWETVLTSHFLVDSVLGIEKRLSRTFPEDQQFCFEQRSDATVRLQCEAYSRAFHEEMKGMVEDRFTKTIHSLGSLWYSAWIDAGQPNLNKLNQKDPKEEDLKVQEELEKQFRQGEIKGRDHSG
ncbi:MAG: zinc dependent phospholipase C family protein [Bacteroidota bacterium]